MKQKSKLHKIYSWTGTSTAFWSIVGLLVVSALWVALSGRYSMAFDEDFHLGIIKIYSSRLLPFLSQQPAQADVFGAMYRDPSFLYHYLMSFPWRIITYLFHSDFSQIVALRILNIGMFASGLLVWRKVLAKTKISSKAVNLLLFLFVLTPVIPLLAAQINYDNLIFPITGLFVFGLQNTIESFQKRKWNYGALLTVVLSGIIGSLTKYAFFPIFVIGVAIIIFYFIKWWKNDALELRKNAVDGYQKISVTYKIVAVVAVLVGVGLMLERYGLNLLRYHSPIPECDQVIGVDRCQAYGPWARNYFFLQQKTTFYFKPFWYLGFWLSRMLYSIMFAVNGIQSNFAPGNPLALPKAAFVLSSALGAAGLLVHFNKIKKLPFTTIFMIISGIYIFILFIQNVSEYIHLGNPVAIQGRYLLPILLLLYYLVFVGTQALLVGHRLLGRVVLAVVMLGFMLGGGALTFIARSDSSWYWENKTVVNINQRAQKIVHTVIPYSN